MRILYITPYFSARQGGVSEVVYQSLTQLSCSGHETTLLTGDFLANDNFYKEGNFRVITVPSLSRWGFYLTPQMIPWLRKNLRDFDLVHLHEFRTFQNIIASFFASKSKIPFFLTCHGTVPNIVERQVFKKVFDILFQKRILQCVDTFIAVSPKEVDDYLQIGVAQEKIRLIYNGIHNDRSFLGCENDQPLESSTRGDQEDIILYLGRLHKRKKIDVLVEAFSILHKQRVNTRLVIAGPDNGELDRLKQQAQALGISERVDFPGPVYGEQKSLLYRSASVLAYPAVHEVFGLVPFEALMCGTPVVVTDEPGMGSIIKEAQAGVTVAKDDPEALAEGITWVLENPGAARQQVISGQEFIRRELSWEKIAGQLESVYQERCASFQSQKQGGNARKAKFSQ